MLKQKKLIKKKLIPIPVDVIKMARAKTQCEAFTTMLHAALRGDFDIADIIRKWWGTAFAHKPFPKEGRTVNELSLAIRYQLYADGFRREGLVIPERVEQNWCAAIKYLDTQSLDGATEGFASLTRCEEMNEMSQIIIRQESPSDLDTTEGVSPMATPTPTTKTKTKTKTKTAAPKAPNTKARTASKANAKTKLTSEKKTGATSSVKKQSAAAYCMELLLKREYTDKEMTKMLSKKFPAYNASERAPKYYRGQINLGRIARIGKVKNIDELVD